MAKDLPNPLEAFLHNLFKLMLRIWALLFYRFRCHHVGRFPETGRGLVCANHQSNLDPMLVGVTSKRNIFYLAKKSLFKRQPLKILRNTLQCIPIDRSQGISGIKSTIKRLKQEKLVLIFPEGSRTKDGQMQKVKGGFLTLARRTKSPLIPVGIQGAFQAYPPGSPFPKLGHIHVAIGDPITHDEFKDMEDAELIQLLDQRIRACVEEATRKREHHISLNIRNRQPKWRLSVPAQTSQEG